MLLLTILPTFIDYKIIQYHIQFKSSMNDSPLKFQTTQDQNKLFTDNILLTE